MKSSIFMHSPLPPDAFEARLRQGIDLEPWNSSAVLSGEMHPLYGIVGQRSFRVYKRRDRRTDIVGALYGKFESDNAGTRVEAHFIAPPTIGYVTRIAIATAVLLSYPISARVLRDFYFSHRLNGSSDWLALIFPLSIAVASCIPRFVRHFGRDDRRFILEYVQQVTSATTKDFEKAIG